MIRNRNFRNGVGKPPCHIIDDSGNDQLEEIWAKYVIGADGELDVLTDSRFAY